LLSSKFCEAWEEVQNINFRTSTEKLKFFLSKTKDQCPFHNDHGFHPGKSVRVGRDTINRSGWCEGVQLWTGGAHNNPVPTVSYVRNIQWAIEEAKNKEGSIEFEDVTSQNDNIRKIISVWRCYGEGNFSQPHHTTHGLPGG
jgi:hypothetical protein